MKALVETTGPFQLYDFTTNQEAPAFRASVVHMTDFFRMQVGLGQLRVLKNDLDEAVTDAQYVAFLAAGGKTVEDFMIHLHAAPAPDPERKKGGKKDVVQ